MSEPSPPPLPVPARSELDRAAERMTWVLRVGLGVALGWMVVALVLLLVVSAGDPESRELSARTLSGYLGGAGLVPGLLAGNPEAYLTLGVYALVATPVVRVVSGAYFFARSGDRYLFRLALAVLGLLLVSLFVLGPLVR